MIELLTTSGLKSPVFSTRNHVLDEMQRVASPGYEQLQPETFNFLRRLTAILLLMEAPTVLAEFDRFQAVRSRGLVLPTDQLREKLVGKKVLITGGTGCIGSVLCSEVVNFNPTSITSLSRGFTVTKNPGVDYGYGDIRDKEFLKKTLKEVRPDIVYHLAAQRDPSLGERDPKGTLSINILGTKNLLEVCQELEVPQVVYASTGKAMRPFTSDTYAASKKIGEWLVANAAAQGDILCSGVRFTHVVDNSIIFSRLQKWIASDQPVRLHSPDNYFYMQSAKESAQLLLNAGLEAIRGSFTIQAIRDLDWPINLVDLALGVIVKQGRRGVIYFCGPEQGYRDVAYPGLYDPLNGGEVSPLANAFEASQVNPSATCPELDVFPFTVDKTEKLVDGLKDLEMSISTKEHVLNVRIAQDALSWELLRVRLNTFPREALLRVAARMGVIEKRVQFSEEHSRVNQTLTHALAKSLVLSGSV